MSSEEYDEFGNYIGDLEGDSYGLDEWVGQSEAAAHDVADEAEEVEEVNEMEVEGNESGTRAIVLAEDKKYYPDADEVYPEVATATMTEDAQDIDTPLVDPMINKNIYHDATTKLPSLEHDTEYTSNLMMNPALVRHVAFIGHIHHGKTSVVHNLFESVKVQDAKSDEQRKAAEESRKKELVHGVRPDEADRGISLKTTLTTAPLEDYNGKHYLVNMLDVPGHVDFLEDNAAAQRLVDGAVIVVDALEGVMGTTEKMIRSAVEMGNRLALVINKVDRLILELRIPPEDAYLKLAHTITEVNAVIARCSGDKQAQVLSPERGNVCFASSKHGWSFTLQSFSSLYCRQYADSKAMAPSGTQRKKVDPEAFALRLWGNWYFHQNNSAISKERASSNGASSRTFVHYVLRPLYKLYAHVLADEQEAVLRMLKGRGVRVRKGALRGNPSDVLRAVFGEMFGFAGSIVRMIAACVPSPLEGSASKVNTLYSGAPSSAVAQQASACSSEPGTPFLAHVTKMFFHYEEREFYSLARVYCGSVRSGQAVQVLGDHYSEENPEDLTPCTVTRVATGLGEHVVDMEAFPACAVAGNLVLLKGVHGSISKGATLYAAGSGDSGSRGGRFDDEEDGEERGSSEVAVFKNPNFTMRSVMSVALEPLKPADLPKMVDGLRAVAKAYPCMYTRVEESGEHVLFGTGELSLDCAMHDLRLVYSNIEVKVAQPFCSLRETVVDTSSLQCFASTTNGKNRFTGCAEPLDKGLSTDLEAGVVRYNDDPADRAFLKAHLKKTYAWDALATSSIWAFGPDSSRANVLLDDTLPTEVDKKVLSHTKNSIVQGFQWGTREGPLCEEPMRDVKFKILDASLDPSPIQRGGGQVIPATRRLVYSSFLTATPRLMEPVYAVEVQASGDMGEAVSKVLNRRRGHIVKTAPKPGAPFRVFNAYLPVVESLGFQVDLRSFTQGQVFAQQDFDHWAVAPGDPMDPDVILHPLEPSPPLALSRDFMVKTRRRKGLPEDAGSAFTRFFDDAMLLKLNEDAGEGAVGSA